ncbi:MAG: hypothetical protein ACRETC_03355 [Gammaproteobacteria bacterium]
MNRDSPGKGKLLQRGTDNQPSKLLKKFKDYYRNVMYKNHRKAHQAALDYHARYAIAIIDLACGAIPLSSPIDQIKSCFAEEHRKCLLRPEFDVIVLPKKPKNANPFSRSLQMPSFTTTMIRRGNYCYVIRIIRHSVFPDFFDDGAISLQLRF